MTTQTTHGYPDLRRFGWRVGVHKAPSGYQHPWIVVTADGTFGAWTRAEARQFAREENAFQIGYCRECGEMDDHLHPHPETEGYCREHCAACIAVAAEENAR